MSQNLDVPDCCKHHPNGQMISFYWGIPHPTILSYEKHCTKGVAGLKCISFLGGGLPPPRSPL